MNTSTYIHFTQPYREEETVFKAMVRDNSGFATIELTFRSGDNIHDVLIFVNNLQQAHDIAAVITDANGHVNSQRQQVIA